MRPAKLSFALGAFVVGVAILLLYGASMGHNFLFDEENIILHNPAIRDLSAIPELFHHGFFYFRDRTVSSWKEYYRPLTSLSFALNYHFCKGDPFGYNLTNLLLHFTACLLLFRLLTRLALRRGVENNALLRTRSPESFDSAQDERTPQGARLAGPPAAFFVTLLYAVHPIHVEAVTYIASRGDLLAAIGALSVVLLCLSGRHRPALFVYTAALLCKESALPIPLLTFAAEWSVSRRPAREVIRRSWPLFALALAYLAFRKFLAPVPLGPDDFHLRGAVLRVFSMGDALLGYFRALLMPERFKFTEAVLFAPRFMDGRVFRSVLVFAVFTIAWAFAWKRRSEAFFGWTFFLGALSPYLQVAHFYPEWAEHYFYLPAMGLAVLTASLAAKISGSSPRIKAGLLAAYAFFLVFLCARTLERNRIYSDAELFYETLSKSDSPYAFYGYQNLARLYIENGEWDRAGVPLHIALRMEPDSDVTQQILGVYFLRKDRPERALPCFQRAVSLNPDNAQVSVDLAEVQMRLGRYPEAVKTLEAARGRNPRYVPVYRSLLYAEELAGRLPEALAWGDRGARAAMGGQKETAAMLMAIVRFAYREDQEGLFQQTLARLLREHGGTPWYGDAARVLAGKTPPDRFLLDAKKRYPGFDEEAKVYAMIAYARAHDPEGLRRLFSDQPFGEESQRRPIFRKEFDTAKRVLEKK